MYKIFDFLNYFFFYSCFHLYGNLPYTYSPRFPPFLLLPFLIPCHFLPLPPELPFLLYPGKSFGLKFIPNQSDLFRNLFPRQSELIRVNPKKVFNLIWCNSVNNQSVSIRVNPRLWFRMNPDQSFNPHESEVGILRIDSDWVIRLNHSDLGFIWIKNFFRIGSLGFSLIDSDWILVKIKNLGLTRIETD